MIYSDASDHIDNFTFIVVTTRVPVVEIILKSKVWKKFGNPYSLLRRNP